MKFSDKIAVLFLSFFLLPTQLISAEFTWQGVGSTCGDTLQICIDDAVDGDTVYISTNGPIDENINYSDKSVSLVATEGFHPVFSDGNNITAYLLSGEALFKGLTFSDGRFRFEHSSESTGDLILTIKDNKITKDISGYPVSITSRSIHSMDILIENNHINALAKSTNQVPISIINYASDNTLNGTIQYNKLYGATSGIGLANGGSANNVSSHIKVFSNQIHFGKLISEFSNHGNTNELAIDYISNYMTINDPYSSFGSFNVNNHSGNMLLSFNNNTIINKKAGLGIAFAVENHELATGDISFDYNNNIMSNFNEGIKLTNVSVTENQSNIFHNVSTHENFILHVSDREVDPLLNPYGRLTKDSPAIDSGNSSILAGADLAYVDADGLYREKDGNQNDFINVDVGAFEYGVISQQHINDGTSSSPSRTEFSDESLNLYPDIKGLHVTHQFNIDGGLIGAHNADSFESDYYLVSGRWGVHNVSGIGVALDSVFNVMNILKTYTTFEHQQSDVGNFSVIDKTGLNDNQDKIVQVMQYYDASFPVSNPHTIGVNYLGFNDRWLIQNFDFQTMPLDTKFHIYYQDESFSAWKHVVNVNNIHPTLNFATVLDHRLLNGNSCAQIQVTQSAENGTFNDSPVGVRYDNSLGLWSIYNESIVEMPLNASFHVMINPAQIEQCTDLIYKSSFD